MKQGIGVVAELLQYSQVVSPGNSSHKLCRIFGQWGNKLLPFWEVSGGSLCKEAARSTLPKTASIVVDLPPPREYLNRYLAGQTFTTARSRHP